MPISFRILHYTEARNKTNQSKYPRFSGLPALCAGALSKVLLHDSTPDYAAVFAAQNLF